MVPVVLPVKALVDLPVTERPFGALQEVLVVLEPWTSSWAVHSSSGAGSNWWVGNIELRTKKRESCFFKKEIKSYLSILTSGLNLLACQAHGESSDRPNIDAAKRLD